MPNCKKEIKQSNPLHHDCLIFRVSTTFIVENTAVRLLVKGDCLVMSTFFFYFRNENLQYSTMTMRMVNLLEGRVSPICWPI